MVDEAINRILACGRADLVEQFARLIPFEVIYCLLGLPSETIDTFRRQVLISVDPEQPRPRVCGQIFRAAKHIHVLFG